MRSNDVSKHLRVYVDFSHACSNAICKLLNNMQGKTYNDEPTYLSPSQIYGGHIDRSQFGIRGSDQRRREPD